MTSIFQSHTVRFSPPDSDELPSPPTDIERDSYLQSEHRWIPLASSFGGFLTTVSLLYLVQGQAWAIPLLVPLAITTAAMVLSLLTSVQPRRDTLAGHRERVRAYRPVHYPSVDVFLPSAGEDITVLHNTFWHVSQLQWSGELTVYVLDDSDRDSVRELADAFGYEYRVRPNRGYLKKAGNLRFGFDESSGDFITILDADFVPRPDYLHQLMPYTTEEDVAIVQSPQYFDTTLRMKWMEYSAGATQVLFYRWIQAARDRSDASICVGTCAVYRRSALEVGGGFSAIEHSEDVYTGVDLMRVGYRTRYVPVVVSKGLCPETLDQFSNQQYRWANGSMSLLKSRDFHAVKFSLRQRLCFWSGFMYYIDTAINIYAIALPPILMAFLAPEDVSINNYLFVFLAMVVRIAIVPVVTMGRESAIGLDRVQTFYSYIHSVAVFDVIRGRTDAWQATGIKTRSTTALRVKRLMTTWLILVQVAMWIGIFWRAPEYGWSNYAPMIGFAVFNLVVVYPLMFWRTEFPTLLDPMTLRRKLFRSEISTFVHQMPPDRSTRRTSSTPRSWLTSSWPWLVLMCAVSSALSLRPGSNTTAFQDEGLYVFVGHRMIEHITDGVNVTEYPGAYFSGAPGLFPILAAAADSVGGLEAARMVSMVFVWVAIVATYGVGSQLFGRLAGLLGAAVFLLCGSVIFLSHMATFDAMAMSLVAVALWLTVRSAQQDSLLWAPIIGAVLALAFLTKYATAVYLPGIAVIGMLLTWNRIRWGAVRQALLMVLSAVAVSFFVLVFWAQDLVPGIVSTTTNRTPISPASASLLLTNAAMWIGVILILAVFGAALQWRRWTLVLTLLVFSVIGPAQQIRIGEETSLSKHVAFGMVFAAPLAGYLLAWFIARSKWFGVPFAAAALSMQLVLGWTQSQEFLTSWVDDTAVVEALREEIAVSPNKAILGEEPSAQRYALRGEVEPILWTDTFSLNYGNKNGMDAYREAIDQSHFGTIYLSLNTDNGRSINQYLTTGDTPYRLSNKVPFTRHGEFAGYYLIWTPKVLAR
ncbi:glycosyltransferase family 2 protein [Rhodococcus sp. NPDC076796]|uniref:glycosyltransferase family 2 protein n=1 Tax=Rhodococcus sp. NPDC076796 TaxID=3154859 RepID=UPI00344F6E8D